MTKKTPDIPALRDALAAATPGPTRHYRNGDLNGNPVDEWWVESETDGYICECDTEADAALIVALRNAAPEILDRIEKLERVAEACRSYERVGVATDELRAALANLDGGKG